MTDDETDPTMTGQRRPCHVCGEPSKTIQVRTPNQSRTSDHDPGMWFRSGQRHVIDDSPADEECARSPMAEPI